MDVEFALSAQHEAAEEAEAAHRAARYRRHRRSHSAFLIAKEEEARKTEALLPGGEAAFSLEEFLAPRQHLPLDALRGELEEALGEIRRKRVDILSLEYRAFISLGDGLTGLDTDIQEMRRALLQMHREVIDIGEAFTQDITETRGVIEATEETAATHDVQGRLEKASVLRSHMERLLESGELDGDTREELSDLVDGMRTLGLDDLKDDPRGESAWRMLQQTEGVLNAVREGE